MKHGRIRRRRQVHLIYRGRVNRSFTRAQYIDPISPALMAAVSGIFARAPSSVRRRRRREGIGRSVVPGTSIRMLPMSPWLAKMPRAGWSIGKPVAKRADP